MIEIFQKHASKGLLHLAVFPSSTSCHLPSNVQEPVNSMFNDVTASVFHTLTFNDNDNDSLDAKEAAEEEELTSCLTLAMALAVLHGTWTLL